MSDSTLSLTFSRHLLRIYILATEGSLMGSTW
jgi:hypothetical protein